MYDNLSLERFMAGLKKRNPGEHEFHQAVEEVAESVIPFFQIHPVLNAIRMELTGGGLRSGLSVCHPK